MSDVIRRRGPDDVGYLLGNRWSGSFELSGGDDTPEAALASPTPYQPSGRLGPGAEARGYDLALASRRLAVVDLTPAGHQPMCNEDRSLWIVYNGELYNAPELRDELETGGHRFVSASDTESILHAYETWGPQCVARFNGMWAFAIWDIRRRQLFLSRDRTGIKPLYYHMGTGLFAFASEIKSLLALGIPRRANASAVNDFLLAGLTDHRAMTFFEGIQSLPPAHSMAIDLTDGTQATQRYWALDLNRRLHYGSDQDYCEAFRALFNDVVRVHLISDVPVGTCLSGGMDSSSVVCVINDLIGERGLHVVGMERRQKTFSARYDDPIHDEGHYIDAVVHACGIDAHMIYPAAHGLVEDWPALFRHLEEPFASASIFAQWNVFKLARQAGVTVTLDGQGGDELLGGYMGFFPYHLADLAAGLHWMRLRTEFSAHRVLHGRGGSREVRNLISNLLPYSWRSGLKRRLSRQTARQTAPWLASGFTEAMADDGTGSFPAGGTRLDRGLFSALTYSPLPSLLRFDDRNSMAHSIQSRVPFLDYRLIEFCFSLPAEQKIRAGTTKYILRQAMAGIVPPEVRSRQDKVGFTTPQDAWLRSSAAWVRDVFASPEFRSRPYFNAREVQRTLDEHLGGGANHSRTLWLCLAVELWHRAMAV